MITDQRFLITAKHFCGFWGLPSKHLSYVGGVAADSKRNIHAATNGEQPISVFDQNVRLVDTWGKGVIAEAHGIYIDEADCAYMPEPDSKLYLFSAEGALPASWGEPGIRGRPRERPRAGV